MKSIRAGTILIKGNEVLLMYRKTKEEEYFCFPGGAVEEGETIEKAAIRELMEETSINAKINKLLYHQIYDNDMEQYFCLCDYISGEPKLDKNSIEVERMAKGNNFYNPLWVKIEELKNMLVYPLEIRDLLIEDFKNNFASPVKVQNIKMSELREKI